MKNLLLVSIVVVLFAGCVTVPPPQPVCLSQEAAGSVICALASAQKLSPEEIDSMLLDAALLGIVTKTVKAEELRKAITKTRDWIAKQPALSLSIVTDFLLKESTTDAALAMLISRRIGLLNTKQYAGKILTEYDRKLLLAGCDHQLEQLSLL